MRTTHYFAAVAILSMGIAGCTSTSPTHAASSTAPSTNQTFELPLSAGSGDEKEVSVLLDEHHLKLVTIALRDGASLGPHSAPVPVTILVLGGDGIVLLGTESIPVTRGSLVSLVAGEEHDVAAEAGGDILLLVHYLRAAQ